MASLKWILHMLHRSNFFVICHGYEKNFNFYQLLFVEFFETEKIINLIRVLYQSTQQSLLYKITYAAFFSCAILGTRIEKSQKITLFCSHFLYGIFTISIVLILICIGPREIFAFSCGAWNGASFGVTTNQLNY